MSRRLFQQMRSRGTRGACSARLCCCCSCWSKEGSDETPPSAFWALGLSILERVAHGCGACGRLGSQQRPTARTSFRWRRRMWKNGKRRTNAHLPFPSYGRLLVFLRVASRDGTSAPSTVHSKSGQCRWKFYDNSMQPGPLPTELGIRTARFISPQLNEILHTDRPDPL